MMRAGLLSRLVRPLLRPLRKPLRTATTAGPRLFPLHTCIRTNTAEKAQRGQHMAIALGVIATVPAARSLALLLTNKSS